jgi:hypothetical protein
MMILPDLKRMLRGRRPYDTGMRWVRVLVIVLCLAAAYPATFILLRKRLPITTFEGTALCYFAYNPRLNRWLWTFYWPIHRSGRQPVTDNEWIIEQRNSKVIYIQDMQPYVDYFASLQ